MLLAITMLAAAQQFTVETAPEWDAMFDRTSGWTGADGIYSIPFNGDDNFGSATNTRTLFVFSDTFIGDVNAQGERLPGTQLVNNTLAVLKRGAGADPNQIQFYWRHSGGNAKAVFEPNTAHSQPDEFYWLKDGMIIDGDTHIFAGRFSKVPPPFHREGISMITIPKGMVPPFNGHSQVETTLWLDDSPMRGQVSFGGAIMDNTVEGNAFNPDGFIYVYGIQEDPLNKKALASRVPRDQFTDFAEYRFWDGNNWVADIALAKPMCGRLSNEFSVTPLPNGKFLMAFQQDTIGREVAVRLGASPVGPWGPIVEVYTCPVPSNPPVYTYNAKAHPHLSDPGTLLISYNVNSAGSFWDHFTYADIYRPRFIRLRIQ
ncbi:MAG: DUF4185 domain-containing protein [Planctomycetes bacterium]|nr:DUF4185 domain-containing protein [Planctomycetota bacterium]